jgi:hypothetical protein
MKECLLLCCMLGVLASNAFAQGNSQSVNAHQFAVIMDGAITIDATGLNANLYSVSGHTLIGKTTRVGSCISFSPEDSVPPFFPPCESPPDLSSGQFYYEDDVVVFELPGGTITGSLQGWEVFNSKPPVSGGDRSATAVEEGQITGGTGKYENARGTFFSRISDEFKTVEIFGFPIDAPYWFNDSVVIFDLR